MAPARAAPAPPLPLPLPLLLALALPLALALVAGQAAAAAVAPRADLNEKCESSEDCVIDHSWCSDNTCKCEENFVEIDPTKCLPQVGYDEKCEDTQQCLHLTPKQTPTLINCAFGTCRCPTGSHYRAKTCWVSSNLGNPCTNDNQCYPEYSSCQGDAQNMQCKCIAGYEEQDSECVVEVPHCELIPGTTEEEGKCVCIDPDAIIITINNNKECVTEAFGGINEPCVQDIQCQLRMGDGAVCAERTKLCSCASGYHYLHGVCWRSAGYGEECTADAECVGHGEWDAYACVHNACACAPDAVAKRPGAQPLCRRIARENEECESKLDCIEGLECGNPTSDSRGTYCYQSTSNRVFNTSTYRMSAAAGPRGECGENEVWTESGSKCVCARGFFRLSSAAPCTPELGESCRVGTVNPDIPHSLCRRSAKFPYVPPASDEGAAATGEEGVWSCSGGYAPGPDNRNCHETQVFRSKCTLDIQCGYYGGRCIGSKCICAEEYVYIADRQLCWPTSGLEESCISNEVCSVGAIGTVECDFSGSTDDHPEGICVCKNGFHAADGDCREDAESLGDPCIGANDCVFAEGDLSVTCTDGQCACREGYVQHSPTICIPEITIKCELIPGAIEENGECVCEDRDYVIDGSRSKCIISALDGAGAACEESAQCLLRMGQGAGCVGGACACLEGFHYLHGECWPTKGFGDACSHDAECYQYAESDAYACVNGHCACAADASGRRPEPNPICRRNAREGEECESTLDCVDNLICDKPTANALDSICQEASRLSGPQVNSTANPASGSRGRGRWSEAQRQQLVAPAEGDGRLVCGLHEQLTPSQTACMCQRGYYRPTSNSECVPELGEPCFVGDDASIPHVEYASCRRSAKLPPAATQRRADEAPAPDGVWACMGGFVPAPSNRECEKTRQNAFNCQVNAQCGYFGGICNVRSCSCESKYHYVSDKFICWPTQGLHEECESDIDCSVSTANSIHCEIDSSETENPSEPEGLAVKTKGICDCKSGYYPVSGDCRKEAYSLCDDNSLDCIYSSPWTHGFTARTRGVCSSNCTSGKLTDSCVGAEDCRFAKDDPTISCVSRQCSCVYGYFPFNETACQVGVGGRCARTPDCEHVANAECLDGECTCRTGFVRGGADKCLPVATEYGEECEEDDQCAPLTPGQSTIYCDSVCSCWPNMHYHNNGCWSTKYLDQKCGHQSECIVENSVCRNNYCTCDYGFVDDGSNGCVNGSPVSVVGQSVFSLMLVVLASRFL